MDNPAGTNFTNAEQTNKKNPGPVPKITMLSPEGKALAERTAPDDAYQSTTISQSGVDRAMRGGKRS
jgi:hypothetical protein